MFHIYTLEEELPNKTNKKQSIFLAGSINNQLSHNLRPLQKANLINFTF